MSPLTVLAHSIWYTRARIRTTYVHNVLGRLLITLGALFFLAVGLVVGSLWNPEMPPTSQADLLLGLMFLVAYITLLRWFVPGYQVKQDKVPALLPVSPGARYTLDLLTDLLSPSQLMLTLLPVGLLLASGLAAWAPAMAILGVQWGTHLLRRSVQVVLERRLRRGPEVWFVIPLLALVIATGVYGIQHIRTSDALWLPGVILGLLVLLDILLHRLVVGQRTSGSSAGGKWGGFSLLWAHKPTRQMLLFSWAFKVLFLYVYGLVLYPPNSAAVQFFNLQGLHPVCFFMIGPWVLASYIFNNTWGYYTGLWLQLHLASGRAWTLVTAQLQLARPALLLDAALSLGFLLAIGFVYDVWAGQLLGFWLVGALTVVPLMVIASLRAPRILPQGGWFTMRQRTNQTYSWLALGLIGLQMLVFVHWVAWAVVLLAVGAMWWWLVDTLRDYPRLSHGLYARLFKPDGR